MTSWKSARLRWKTWDQLPPDAQRDLLWAWAWSRPCSIRDVVFKRYWLEMGAEGGVPAFLAHEDPVWAVELLHLSYPKATLADLEHAAGLLFGLPGATIAKRRTLREGGKSSGWIAECERHVKAEIKDWEAEGASLHQPPWDAATVAWMASPLSLNRFDALSLGPWKVSRWIQPAGLAWSASFEDRPGFMRKAFGGGPKINRRILVELDGWEPPGFPAGVLNSRSID